MRIGELAHRTGVSVRSLRYYEQQGLLVSERSPRGQRHYCEQAVERVLFLQRLYSAGLTSHTILHLLPCVEAPSPHNTQAALERMTQERDKLSSHITELTKTRDTLDAAIRRVRRTQHTPQPQPTNT